MVTPQGEHYSLLDIPSVYFPFIIGKHGNTKYNIEKDSGARLFVPKNQNEVFTVSGPTKNSVLKAKTKIEIICETANENLPYTHFLSIPVNFPELMTSVSNFQKEIIQESERVPIEGFDGSICQPPESLHLTLLMLKLHTEKQVQTAQDILKKITPELYDMLETRSLVVRFKGLEIMNDDPSQVDVLYLQVLETDSSNRLAKLSKFIVDQFKKHNLVSAEQDRPVKLHVTLFNTRYRRKEEEQPHPSAKVHRETFDAHGIINKYQDHDFGTLKIPELHLSQRSAYDKKGYYKCVSKVVFP
uniref:K Homology domain-containing protein n=1 Tax=Arcella intermedia TaxID=1963864 RepID=A0A6B2LAP0_9EUKA